jgi:hypothetical protein
MATVKISANIEHATNINAQRLYKRLGYRTFSNFVDYCIRSVLKDPGSIIEYRMKESLRDFNTQRDLLKTLDELKQAQQESKFVNETKQKEEYVN